MIRLILTALLVWVSGETAPAADSPPRFLRLAIVDDSGSMSGKRIAIVRQELRRVIDQLPPSGDFPFILVTFGTTAAPPRSFTDPITARAAVDALTGSSGGTDIAAGLARGRQELERLKAVGDVVLLLYSDGRDGNTAAISREEARLDSLFADRRKTGLRQTVFCKRWGNAGASLVERLRRSGSARVIDAGTADVRTLTLQPQVELVSARWHTSRRNVLEVRIRPRCQIRGQLPNGGLPPVRFRCVWPGITAGATIDLDLTGTPGPPVSLLLPVPVNHAGAAPVQVPFLIDQAAPDAGSGGVVLPLLSASRFTLPVPLPDRTIRGRISVTAVQPSPLTWLDPLAPSCRLSLTLNLVIEAVNGGPLPAETTVTVSPLPGTRILAGPDSVTLKAGTKREVPLTLAVSPQPGGQSALFGYGLAVRPQNVPAHVQFQPAEVRLADDRLIAPAPVTTRISTRRGPATAPVWTDAVAGLAAFEAAVSVRLDGPVPPGTTLVIVAPPAVSQFTVSPRTVHRGEQTVRLRVMARLSPGQQLSLPFIIRPPSPIAGVRFSVAGPIRLEVTGPPALQLVPRGGPRLAVTVADNATFVPVPFSPVTIGGPAGSVDGLPSVLAVADGSLQAMENRPVPVSGSGTARFAAPVISDRSFFEDTVMETPVELRPGVPTVAVVGSRCPLLLRITAPFKRLALQLAISISGLLAVLLLMRMFIRLRQVEE